MRSLAPRLLVSLLSAFSSMTYAGNDNTAIDIQVTHIEYLRFVGTAVGIKKYFSSTEIRPATKNGPNPTLSIGTFGLESSVSGNCTLDFSSANAPANPFTLMFGNQKLTKYQLDYKGTTIDPTNLTMVLPSCNAALTSIDFTATGKIKKKLKAGVYSDIITITVTSQ